MSDELVSPNGDRALAVGDCVARPTRRRFLQGIASGGVLAAFGGSARGAAAPLAAPAVLQGSEFELVIGEAAANFTGRTSLATVVNASLPAPLLRWREGDTVALRVRNDLDEDTSIHWHGILLPFDMDGVPGVSFHGIPSGETFTYRFEVRQSGTYWYHAHSGFQEQRGLYGPLIIAPRDAEPFSYDREHVVLLSDWTDRDPLDLYRLLKRQPGYFNYNDRTLGDFVRDSRRDGFKTTWRERTAWGRMRMKPSDLADVGGRGYTYLMNGVAPAGNWTGVFARGERVRLRFINGSAMSIFDVRIPGLEMTVVAADGQYVRPVTVEEFRLSAAETLDVLVQPSAEAYTVFAQSMDRAGFARGTLALREGAAAAVPSPDPVVFLSMADMGHETQPAAAAANAHAEHAAPGPAVADEHAAHAVDAVHGGHASDGAVQAHPPSEARNRGVDMQAAAPTPRLDDPGVGLRNNGRRVLTYADLQSAFPDPDGRAPERTLELHLTGHMERFVWSFDGIPFSGSAPLELNHGERVRIVLVNDTMMEHPIHLHGMWSDLENAAGEFQLRKHTISMPPGTKRSFRVTADAPGPWAFHCHLLYHMESGMFRVVRVSSSAAPAPAPAPAPAHEHAAHPQV